MREPIELKKMSLEDERSEMAAVFAELDELSPEQQAILAFWLKEESAASAEGTVADSIRPVSREGGLPLSFAQQRLWFLDQLQPASHVYNVPLAVRLRGPLDLAALRRALHLVAARHEVLRTCFPSAGGRPRQLIRPRASLPLPLFDLGGLPGGEREARALELAAAQARLPFDLARGPLARALALRLGEGEHLLSLTLHHIISDGWSLAVLVREAAALYGEAAGGAAAGLEPLAVQYGDYAAWERGRMGEGGWLAEQLSYWRGQLGGAEPLELPTDYPRPESRGGGGARHRWRIGPGPAAAMRALCRGHEVTLFMGLLAVFKVLLWRYSGETDIVVGTAVAGRTRAEVE